MAILFLRTIIVYAFVVFSLRLMGKRQIGQLQPSELVVAIMISDLATMPMSDVSVPLLYGIVPILTLVICEMLLSFLSLKNEKIRVFLSGRPQELVKNGKLCVDEMLSSRINIDDLMEELRKAGYFSLNDIDTAILETGGTVSVIPSADSEPVTKKDMEIESPQTIVPYIFVADGSVRQSELKRSGRNDVWLKKTLKSHKLSSPEDVFLMSEDGDGNLFIQRKEKKK